MVYGSANSALRNEVNSINVSPMARKTFIMLFFRFIIIRNLHSLVLLADMCFLSSLDIKKLVTTVSLFCFPYLTNKGTIRMTLAFGSLSYVVPFTLSLITLARGYSETNPNQVDQLLFHQAPV